MPFGDGTGPRGMGPMTGRGAGYCAGFGQPGFTNLLPWSTRFGLGWRPQYFGWGYGRGRVRGRGFGLRRLMPYGNPWW